MRTPSHIYVQAPPPPPPKSHAAALPGASPKVEVLCIGGHIDHADDIKLGAQKSLVADGLQVGGCFRIFREPDNAEKGR